MFYIFTFAAVSYCSGVVTELLVNLRLYTGRPYPWVRIKKFPILIRTGVLFSFTFFAECEIKYGIKVTVAPD
jgi:hypothetical protein